MAQLHETRRRVRIEIRQLIIRFPDRGDGLVPHTEIQREPVGETPIILCESGVCPLREMARRLPQKYGCGSGRIQRSGEKVRQVRKAERAARAGVRAAAICQVTSFSTELERMPP